jgi:hypothetical protein
VLRTENQSLLPKYAERIESEPARLAFFMLVGAGCSHPALLCDSKEKGVVLDFRYYTVDGKRQPFAFIINKRSTLFYLRKPAVTSGIYQLDVLKSHFSTLSENNSGDWTVPVFSVVVAEKII